MSVLAFDLDGTLVDCRPRQVEALHAALGYRYDDPDAFWRHKRSGATTREALMLRGMAEHDADVVAGRWLAVVETDEMLAIDALLEGTVEALRAAREHAHRLIVITARTRGDAALAQCDRLGLGELLDEVIAVRPADASDNKAALLRDLRPLGFVGDTNSDARAARTAGTPFVAVTTGQHTREILAAEAGGAIVDSLSEAVAILTAG